jgi:hypothetical protein
MQRKLKLTGRAKENLRELERDIQKKGILNQVRKALALLESNLRHPGLHIHRYEELSQRYGVDVFEAYVQNQTPGAYRVFWAYGPDEIDGKRRVPVITIVDITPHP